MGCISNCWRRQLFVWKLACYSWIHDDAVNLLCLLWNPLHSPTKLTFSHRSLAFSGVSLHNSDIAMSLVGFLSNGLQKHITHQGCFCLVLQVWCSALDSWLVPRNLHLPYVWNQEFSDTWDLVTQPVHYGGLSLTFRTLLLDNCCLLHGTYPEGNSLKICSSSQWKPYFFYQIFSSFSSSSFDRSCIKEPIGIF